MAGKWVTYKKSPRRFRIELTNSKWKEERLYCDGEEALNKMLGNLSKRKDIIHSIVLEILEIDYEDKE